MMSTEVNPNQCLLEIKVYYWKLAYFITTAFRVSEALIDVQKNESFELLFSFSWLKSWFKTSVKYTHEIMLVYFYPSLDEKSDVCFSCQAVLTNVMSTC